MFTFTVVAGNACIFCNTVHRFEVDSEYASAFQNGYRLWQEQGAFIQDALPFLTAGQREILMTGTGDECWDAMFQEEDEHPENLGEE